MGERGIAFLNRGMTRIACWGADGPFPFFRVYGRWDFGQGERGLDMGDNGEASNGGLERR